MNAIPRSDSDYGWTMASDPPRRPAPTYLEQAEGIIMGWQGCTAQQAVDALLVVACRNRLRTLRLARELIIMANGDVTESTEYRTALIARWGRYLPEIQP